MQGFFGKLATLANEYLSVSKLFVVLLVAAITTGAYYHGLLDPFENVTLDQRFKLRPQQFTHPKIILIEIAEDSVVAVGRWPWSREWHATLVKALSDFGAKAVAFDVLFSEPSTPETDTLFAQNIAKAKNVYLPVAFSRTKGGAGEQMTSSIPPLREAIRGEGHITILPDPDGLLRRIKPRYTHEGRDYLQLGLKMALDLYGVNEKDLIYRDYSIEVPIPNNPTLKIPLTQEGDLILNWTGTWKQSFFHVSFIDVVVSYAQWLKGQKPRLPPEIFDDAICIVGVTATGLFDIRSIPLEPAYPAVGVNATVLNSVLERNFLTVVNDRTNLIILWVFAVVIFLVTLRFSYLQSTILIVTLAVLHAVLAVLLFVFGNIVLNIVYPLFQIVTSFISLTTYHQIVITMEKRRLMRLATKDSMTGLFNIGHFKLLLAAELRSIKLRRNKDLSVIMVDVDFFKKINDTFGHAAGDEVLRAVAEVLRLSSRSLDVACRYGGEEFILMLPGAALENAVKVGEKLRKAVQDLKFELGEKRTPHPVTASFGVAAYNGSEPAEEFIKRADKALYQAKETGRNRVCPTS